MTPNKSAVHLWEFLLELLADESCSSLIHWTKKEEREFKLKNQEEVARRWGNLKQRPGMNYDKLSRALRYYYQKNIIRKVRCTKAGKKCSQYSILYIHVLISFGVCSNLLSGKFLDAASVRNNFV